MLNQSASFFDKRIGEATALDNVDICLKISEELCHFFNKEHFNMVAWIYCQKALREHIMGGVIVNVACHIDIGLFGDGVWIKFATTATTNSNAFNFLAK